MDWVLGQGCCFLPVCLSLEERGLEWRWTRILERRLGCKCGGHVKRLLFLKSSVWTFGDSSVSSMNKSDRCWAASFFRSPPILEFVTTLPLTKITWGPVVHSTASSGLISSYWQIPSRRACAYMKEPGFLKAGFLLGFLRSSVSEEQAGSYMS